MAIFLIVVAILIIAGSIFADYKWRNWMTHHRRDRNQ